MGRAEPLEGAGGDREGLAGLQREDGRRPPRPLGDQRHLAEVVTRGSRRVQARALRASVRPRACALSVSPRIRSIASSRSRSGESDEFSAARESDGIPFRYLSVSIPCARGEKTMQPTPSSPSASSRPGSIQRLSSEYDG